MTFNEAITLVQSTNSDFHAWRTVESNQDILWTFKADGTVTKSIRDFIDGKPQEPVEHVVEINTLTEDQKSFLASRVEQGVPQSIQSDPFVGETI